MVTEILQELLASADILLNGSRPWDIRIKDDRWYKRVWREKNLGLGESYMEGWWDCERLDEMFFRLLGCGLDEKVRGSLRYMLSFLPATLFNLQSRFRSRKVAKQHYDLGNDLFLAFLDDYQQYSCGYFEETEDLHQAQQNKLALIAGKLQFTAGDQILDIGCGWGGLARYAVERHGCRVTAVNISREQLRYARESCQGLPVEFLDSDYRSLNSRYDKIVSVGMFEHVGRKNHRTYMKVVHRCMKDEGIFLLHTIGSNVSRNCCDPWVNRYIFPNGMLPGPSHIGKGVEGLFVIEDWHNFGPHYDKTLMAWNQNFQRAWPKLRDRYDERFKRMWEYYLLSCAGAFRARTIQLWQIVMTKQGSCRPQPACRY
jgi:cyclopropane-fatty-acyl-phospholipid synthase